MFRGERTSAEGEGRMRPLTPTRQPWTFAEQKKLDDLLEAGKTIVEIAPLLQRTRQAIYARLQRRYRKRRKPSDRSPSAL
jgi:IS30 family transposase